MSKSALIVAPFYDGAFVPSVPGGEDIVDRAQSILASHGGYSTRTMTGPVTRIELNQALDLLASSDGSLLFFFFGHGVRRADRGYLAMTDSRPFDEGISTDELIATLFRSRAREAIVVLDCCHAGAAAPAAVRDLGGSRELGGGRALLAACAENQSAWADVEHAKQPGGVFANILLDGLEGAAARMGRVRASSLIDYAGNCMAQWAQSPVMVTNEAGDRFCVITEGFAPGAHDDIRRASMTSMRRLGVPFRPSSNFVGREAEIDRLVSLLGQGNGRVSVSATVEGIGGIGKTELIIQLLSSGALEKLFDIVIWIDAAGPVVPQLQEFAVTLGRDLSECNEANIGSRFAAVLQGFGQCLIVVDNATDWDPIKSLLPTEPALLITTRTQGFGGTQFAHIELEGLSDEAARALLIELAPTLANDPDLEPLLFALFGHALAIELAGATIRAQDISAAEYLSNGNRMASSTSAVLRQLRYGKTVEQAINATWESLSDSNARTLWRRAALFAPTIATKKLLEVGVCGSKDAARQFARDYDYDYDYDFERSALSPYLDADVFEAAYTELKERNVFTRVQSGAGGQWSMHRLIREFGRGRADSKEYFAHIYALSDWLKGRGQVAAIDAPHLIAAVLDGAKFGYEIMGQRSRQREIGFRAGLFRSREMVRFIGNEMRNPGALKMLFEGLSDVNEDVRAEAVSMLATFSDLEEVQEGIAVALSDASPSVRRMAARALVRNADARTVDLLTRALATNKVAAKIDVIQTLAHIGRPEAIQPLADSLQDISVAVRDEAAIALAQCGDDRVTPHLLATCASPTEEWVKVRAFRALARLTPSASVTAIGEAASANRIHDVLAMLAGLASISFRKEPGLATPTYLAQLQPVVADVVDRPDFVVAFAKFRRDGGYAVDIFVGKVPIATTSLALNIILQIYSAANKAVSRHLLDVVEKNTSDLWNVFLENLGRDSAQIARPLVAKLIRNVGKLNVYNYEPFLKICECYDDLTEREVTNLIVGALDSYGTDKSKVIALAIRVGGEGLAKLFENWLGTHPGYSEANQNAMRAAIAAMRSGKAS